MGSHWRLWWYSLLQLRGRDRTALPCWHNNFHTLSFTISDREHKNQSNNELKTNELRIIRHIMWKAINSRVLFCFGWKWRQVCSLFPHLVCNSQYSRNDKSKTHETRHMILFYHVYLPERSGFYALVWRRPIPAKTSRAQVPQATGSRTPGIWGDHAPVPEGNCEPAVVPAD